MRKIKFFSKQKLVMALFLLTTILGNACKSADEQQPDVSAIKVQLKSQRLDKDLRMIDTNNLAEGLQSLQTQYPEFLNFYLDTLMGFHINGNFNASNKGISEGLHSFVTYPDYVALFDTVDKHYPDTKDIEEQLGKGFQYMLHYYPKTKLPNIIYFNSGLSNWGVVSYEGILAIGLDMFLGPQYPFYQAVGQPDYMYINFRKQSIAPSVFATLYNDIHPFEDEDKSLLEMMIQKGKQQYFVEKMVPFVPFEDRIGYTKAQVEWCVQNEAMVYNFFLNENLLFEKNWGKMRRFVVYGPNTSGMPAESPGNIGTWLGLQIVKAYVQNNPEENMDKMLSNNNAEQFLKKAKYKPRK